MKRRHVLRPFFRWMLGVRGQAEIDFVDQKVASVAGLHHAFRGSRISGIDDALAARIEPVPESERQASVPHSERSDFDVGVLKYDARLYFMRDHVLPGQVRVLEPGRTDMN